MGRKLLCHDGAPIEAKESTFAGPAEASRNILCEDHKAYYAKGTGLCEGSVQEIRDKQIKETVVRVH
jgi:hypothetical protein